MANVLSQDEVDSLLNGISKGTVETETDGSTDEGDLKAYDFSQQTGPIHLRLPALGIINERFVGFLKASLSSATGSVMDVNLESVESVRFGKFTRSIPLPASLNIFKMEPLRGLSMLVLEGSLVFAFVDILFGGRSVNQVKLEGKNFTTIEARIINKIVKIILADFEQAWSDVHKINTSFVRSEVDPQFAGIATPGDMVVTVKFTVDLETFTGGMTLCIPYNTVEPLREKLKSRFQSEKLEVDQTWRNYLEDQIGGMKVSTSCILGRATIIGKELLEMKVDDVIQLDQKVNEPISISVEGIEKFKGYPGARNQLKAVRIVERLPESR